MARTPNYKFERMEKQRQKAAKKAEKLKAKQDKSAARQGGDSETEAQDPGASEESDVSVSE